MGMQPLCQLSFKLSPTHWYFHQWGENLFVILLQRRQVIWWEALDLVEYFSDNPLLFWDVDSKIGDLHYFKTQIRLRQNVQEHFLLSSRSPRPPALDKNNMMLRACMLCGRHILGLLSSIHDQRGETLPLYWINFTTSCDRTQEKTSFKWWFLWRVILFIFNHI